MKILYVARLFSGLERSVLNRSWNPAGVPTSYKLVEYLDSSDHEVEIVFTPKDPLSSRTFAAPSGFFIQGLRSKVHLLTGPESIPGWFGKARPYLLDLYQLFQTWVLARRFKPDLIYVGHANIWTGVFFARISSVSTVFRVMGIYPGMRAALLEPRLVDKLFRWAYRSPWSAVIATQDGSGIESWLDRAISPNVPTFALLNGVDEAETYDDVSFENLLAGVSNDATVVTFVARLHPYKGCMEFMEGFLSARARAGADLQAIVVGDGPLLDDMRARVEEARATEDVFFTGLLPHSQVSLVQDRADIYVSLNRFGNLSNANLEAMKAGKCMVIPAARPESGVDVATDRLLAPETVFRIPSSDDSEALADAILTLHQDPGRRKKMSEAMRELAQRELSTWEERVTKEVQILVALDAARAPEETL